MDADNLSYVKFIATNAPTFFGYIISDLAIAFFDTAVVVQLEDIVPHFLRMMTALTDTSSPELPHSLSAVQY